MYQNWNDICPIKAFYFTINDKFKGVAAPIHQMVIELEKRYPKISINLFIAKDLERIFDKLDDCYILDIVGFIPESVDSILEYEALGETVKYLLNVECSFDADDKLVVPNFEEKIIFNNLSESISRLITTAGYQEGTLRKYFNENPGVEEILQNRFKSFYNEAKTYIDDKDANYSDKRFFYILEKACVKNTLSIRNSVLVLMACYFASCDIFEEPISNKISMIGGK